MRRMLFNSLSVVILVVAMVASPGSVDASQASAEMMDCNIKISGVFNGTPVNVVITVYDVSLVECMALKAAAILATPKK